MNQGFRLGKCFQLYYANVTEIRGKLENDHLKVCQKLRKISISKCIMKNEAYCQQNKISLRTILGIG